MSARPAVVTEREELAILIFLHVNSSLDEDEAIEKFFLQSELDRAFWMNVADAVKLHIKPSLAHRFITLEEREGLVDAAPRAENLESRVEELERAIVNLAVVTSRGDGAKTIPRLGKVT